MTDLLDQLDRWAAKHRTATLQCGGFRHAGDGWCITLYCQKTRRRVHVHECDVAFAGDPDEGLPDVTPAMLVGTALGRWAVLEARGLLEWPGDEIVHGPGSP